MSLKVVAVAGSLREQSYNKKLLALAVAGLTKRGVEADVWDLRALGLPSFDEDQFDAGKSPPAVADLKARAAAAQGLLIASPEYNYTIPGPLKTLLDWISRPPQVNPFAGKVAMQVGATKGKGGTLLAQKDLRHLLSMGFRMWVMPGVNVIVSLAEQSFDEHGQLKDAALVKQLDSSLDAFVAELTARAKR